MIQLRNPQSQAYDFKRGDGILKINYSTNFNEPLPVLSFGEGIAKEDLVYKRIGLDLEISIKNTTDKILVSYEMDQYSYLPAQISLKFNNGFFLSYDEVSALCGIIKDQEGVIIGNNQNDSHNFIIGSDSNDYVFGLGGDDIIHGGDGIDIIYGGAGNDEIFGDHWFSEGFTDFIKGGDGNDIIYGAWGDDILYGDAGDDTIYGGAYMSEFIASDNDVINGGRGNDILDGGMGNDVYIFENAFGNDEINGWHYSGDMDTIQINSTKQFTVNPLDLMFQQDGNAIDVKVLGTENQIKIKYFREDDGYQIETLVIRPIKGAQGEVKQIVNSDILKLIDAMSTFTRESGISWQEAIEQKNTQAMDLVMSYYTS